MDNELERIDQSRHKPEHDDKPPDQHKPVNECVLHDVLRLGTRGTGTAFDVHTAANEPEHQYAAGANEPSHHNRLQHKLERVNEPINNTEHQHQPSDSNQSDDEQLLSDAI